VTTSFTRGENPLRADKLNQAFSERVSRGGDTMRGVLTLWADPLTAFDAATKQYVDRLATGSGGVYLPLSGGTLTGPLQLPNGTIGSPSLGFGAPDGTGIDRSGGALTIGVGGVYSVSFFANSVQSYGQLYMLGNKIVQVGDATGATDALNQRTGDARYLPAGGGPFLPLSGGTLSGDLVLGGGANAGPPTLRLTGWGATTGTIGPGDTFSSWLEIKSPDTINIDAGSGVNFSSGSSLIQLTSGSGISIASPGNITVNKDPITPLGVATKQYVDAAVAPLLAEVASLRARLS
jgi:hypothetical protein